MHARTPARRRLDAERSSHSNATNASFETGGEAATVDGDVVASVPYTAQAVGYVGVEGSLHANVDNFTVRAGTVTDPAPDAVAPPATG